MRNQWTTDRPTSQSRCAAWSRRPDDVLMRMEELCGPPGTADQRILHENLRDADTAALGAEEDRLGLCLLLADRHSQWVLERLNATEVELKARHRNVTAPTTPGTP